MITVPTVTGPDVFGVLVIESCGKALVLVRTQLKSAPATTFPDGIVRVVPERLPKDPVLVVLALLASVHEPDVIKKSDADVSVNVTAVPIDET